MFDMAVFRSSLFTFKIAVPTDQLQMNQQRTVSHPSKPHLRLINRTGVPGARDSMLTPAG